MLLKLKKPNNAENNNPTSHDSHKIIITTKSKRVLA